MTTSSQAAGPSTPERPVSFDPSEAARLDLSPRTLSYLSSLPTHLRPASPYLAALHDARLTLLNIPYAKSPIRWCATCGALRDFTPAPVSPGIHSSPGKKGALTPSPGKARTNKCVGCGKAFRRAKKAPADQETLRAFRPARTVRKERGLRPTASMSDINVLADSALGVGGPAPSDVFAADPSASSPSAAPAAAAPVTLESADDVFMAPADAVDIVPTDPPDSASSSTLPTPYHMPLASPSLRYIPSTAPTPPSYIQPPPVRATSSPVSATASSDARLADKAKADSEGAKRKKKKSSGLAKLLAQSKEREEGAIGGKWGFG